ncbi:DUF5722 domain-containing protein [Neolewinella antarctica]|uniref:DUF5722 domain-containing protein n=1 Tax=Neolewinella antarctica TaxID=442734 RepID=A0ABX0XGI9_9BACT|nr:DUF5722 domain-containing protein [Neolewinella antarctica]NJC28321.1 hypothetical protein [Neolewinella antarctica]
MQTKFTFLSLLLLAILGTGVRAQSFDLAFDTNGARRMTITEPTPGTYAIAVTGNDAFVPTAAFSPGSYDPDNVYVISFEYDAPAGLDFLEIFYGPVNSARRVTFADLPATTGFQTFKAFMKFDVDNWDSPFQSFRFDFSRTGRPSLSIRNLQLRAPTATEVIPLNLDPAQTNPNATTVTPDGNGGFDIVTSGADPWVATQPFTDAYDPATTYVLQYDYFGDALDDFRVFFGEPWTPTRMAEFGPLPAAATATRFTGFMQEGDVDWLADPVTKLRLDFGRQPGKTINVNELYLREPTFSEAADVEPPVVLETVPLEFNVGATSSGLIATETGPREYEFNTSGNDPWIRTKSVTELYNIDSTYIIEFEYQAAEGYNLLEIFFGPPINGTQLLNAGELPAATGWTTFTVNPRLFLDNFQDDKRTEFRFDFGKNENVAKTILIRNPVLRKPTAQEKIDERNSDKFLSQVINQQFNQYRTTTYADRVSDVKIDETEVTITGTLTGAGPYFLAEVDPEDYGFNLDTYENLTPITAVGGEFTVTQTRFAPLADRDKDRLYARWVVVTDDGDGTYTKTSPLSWATDIVAIAANNLAEEKAETVKGLDGLSPYALANNFGDLTDLGVKSMKINLLLNGVFALNANANTTTYQFNGKSYNINQNFVDNLDSRIVACTNAGIKTSFVLLIPVRFNNPVIDSIFRHPDASLGLYSMANVATPAGVEHYTMLVDFLAKRYSRPDGLYGRMDQWIIHNEVDAHTSWTHAGQKPAPLYTQIYDRSMRMVHFTARKYNPTAKVFSSFTKHFASKVGGENGPNFRSKEILTVLGGLMKLESDYEWGIGWHSYPTNLFNPKVWEDSPATTPLNFNAAQITPRNLEVIDAYVRQESVLYNGKKVRTILLSENGFSSNADRNANANETTQAAALAYFWKKTYRRLPAIENIQLHRWVDNPNEAGLEFGLWTNVPGTVEEFNTKKEGWFVWEAAGTNQEDAVLDPYRSTIGISDWSEIQFAFASETTPWPVTMSIACDDPTTETVVSFNGEKKMPQPDGTLEFYNVASDVDQPYEVYRDGALVASDVLMVTEPTTVNVNLCTLPVEWLSFTARAKNGKQAVLNWETTVETENAGFRVERSGNARSWELLADVPALPASTQQRYELVDEAPLGASNYYRITQRDFDGTESTSPVRRVQFSGAGAELSISPNPSNGILKVQPPAGEVVRELELVDATGRVSLIGKPDAAGNINLGGYATGVYVLRMIAETGAVFATKVVLR